MKDLVRSFLKVPVLEKLWRKYTLDKEYGSGITKFTPNHYTFPPESNRLVEINKINYQLDISNIIDWYIYFGFKEKSKENLFKLIDTDFHIFDVGANIGDMTLNFALRTEKGKVYAFEPYKPTLEKLSANLHLNHFNNINSFNFGFGNQGGEFVMEERQKGNPGMNRVIAGGDEKARKITLSTIDEFVEENEIKKLDLIKIDVEGFEYNVLLGGKKTLRKFQPILYIELDDLNLKDQNASARLLVEFLIRESYSIRNAETLQGILSESDFTNCHFDIICTKK